jgi:hypothetical protein
MQRAMFYTGKREVLFQKTIKYFSNRNFHLHFCRSREPSLDRYVTNGHLREVVPQESVSFQLAD